MADALHSTYRVFRNRLFLNELGVFAKAVEKQVNPSAYYDSILNAREIGRLFTPANVIKCLAYGNQGGCDMPQYPIDDTPVVNVIGSSIVDCISCAAKIKTLAMFIESARRDGSLNAVLLFREVIPRLTRWFGITDRQAALLIDELFVDEIIGNWRSVELPSVVGEVCELHLTERGWQIWKLLGKDSVLVECFHDDLELDTDLEWDGRPVAWSGVATSEIKDVNDRVREVFCVLLQVWRAERNDGNRAAKRGEYRDYASAFGRDAVAEWLMKGVESSLERYYATVKGFHSKYCEHDLNRLKYEIATCKKVWETGGIVPDLR